MPGLNIEIASPGAPETRANLDAVNASGQRLADTTENLTQKYINERAEMARANEERQRQANMLRTLDSDMQRLLGRYDPMGAKLRALQADFAKLETTLNNWGGDTRSADAMVNAQQRVVQEIAKVERLMKDAGVSADVMGDKIDGATKKAVLGSRAAQRELAGLAREIVQGDFQRLPGTFINLARDAEISAASIAKIGGPIALVAGAAAALFTAFEAGQREVREMNNAIAASGNMAGTTRGQMLELAEAITKTGHVSIGVAKQVVTDMVQSGKLGQQSLQEVARLAESYANATNQNITKAGADLTRMFADPARGADELNRSMNLLTASEQEHIDQLVRIGNLEEARLVLADRLSERMRETVPNLGLVERAWDTLRNAASRAWDAMLNIGREQTLEQKLEAQRKTVEGLRQQMESPGLSQRAEGPRAQLQAQLDAAQAYQSTLEQQLKTQRDIATTQGQVAEQTQRERLAQDEINKGKAAQIRMLQQSLELVRSAPDSPEKAARVAEIQKQITDMQRGSAKVAQDTAREQIQAQMRLQDVELRRMEEANSAALKLGQITKAQYDAEKTSIDLLRNMEQQRATERELALRTLTARERQAAQSRLDVLRAEATLIRERGQNQALAHDRDEVEKMAAAWDKVLMAVQSAGDKTNASLRESIEKQLQHNDAIGRSKEEIERAAEARDRMVIAEKEALAAQLDALLARTDLDERARTAYELMLRALREEILLRRQLANIKGEGANLQNDADFARDAARAWQAYAREAERAVAEVRRDVSDFLYDIITDTDNAGQKAWEKFKQWALRAFTDIMAQEIIVSIVGRPTMGGGAGGSIFDFGKLLGMGGTQAAPPAVPGAPSAPGGAPSLPGMGGGGFGGLWNTLPSWLTGPQTGPIGMGPPAPGMFGGNSMTWGQMGSTAMGGAAMGMGVGSIASMFFGNGRNETGMQAGGAIGGAIGSIIPGIGTLIGSIIGTALGSLFKSGGGPKSGGSAMSNVDLASGRVSLMPMEGDARFFTPSNADRDLGKIVKQIGSDYRDVAQSLGIKSGNVSFGLGYDVDPKGTADSRVSSSFMRDGVEVYGSRDRGIGRDEANVQAEIENETARLLLAALQNSELPDYLSNIFNSIEIDAATAEDVQELVATAQALKVAVDVVKDLGPAFAALTPEQVQGLMDAFGGVDQFAAAFQNFNATMLTDAERFDNAKADLAKGFADLGITMPTTAQGMRDLIGSYDLTDEAQQKVVASLMELVPLWTQVNGTAQQQLEQERARQANVRSALYTQDQRDTMDRDALNKVFTDRGVEAPKTHTDYLAMLETAYKDTSEEGVAFYNMLRDTLPEWARLNGTADDWAKSLADAESLFDSTMYTEAEQAARKRSAAEREILAVQQEIGVTIPTTSKGFREFVEYLRNSTDPALHAMYEKVVLLTPEIIAFNEAITATILNISRPITGDDLQSARDQVAAVMDTIANMAGTMPDADLGDRVAVQLRGIGEMIGDAQRIIARYSNDPLNRGFAVIAQAQLDTLMQQRDALTGTLARFTILTAQYGADKAEELIALEDWQREQEQLLQGNDAALRDLDVIFRARWQAIIDGTSDGVDRVQEQLERIRKSILEYVDRLKIGPTSMLTPQQRLDEAERQYQETLAGARRAATGSTAEGDIEDFGNVTQAFDAFYSMLNEWASPRRREVYEQGITDLTALGTAPAPAAANADFALTQALPKNDTIASAGNIAKLGEVITAALAAVANANTTDVRAQTSAYERMQQRRRATADLGANR
jgi:hypothetical protein